MFQHFAADHPQAMDAFKVTLSAGAVAAAALATRYYFTGAKYRGNNRIDGKTVVITGGNAGIGKETAMELARRGARVIIASRDVTKSEAVKKEIIEATQNENIACKKLDLCSLSSVRAFAEDINKTEARLDILINNAGIMMIPKKSMTEDGLEKQMALNHFGHFLLTNLLLDKLKASVPSRIIILSSVAHLWGHLDFDNLNSEKNYHTKVAYYNSKLSNLLHMTELVNRLEGTRVTVNSVHPGLVDTGLDKDVVVMTNPIVRVLYAPVKFLGYKNARQGAETTLTVALDPKYETVTGKYLSDCREKAPLPEALDDAVAKRLWQASEELTKIKKE